MTKIDLRKVTKEQLIEEIPDISLESINSNNNLNILDLEYRGFISPTDFEQIKNHFYKQCDLDEQNVLDFMTENDIKLQNFYVLREEIPKFSKGDSITKKEMRIGIEYVKIQELSKHLEKNGIIINGIPLSNMEEYFSELNYKNSSITFVNQLIEDYIKTELPNIQTIDELRSIRSELHDWVYMINTNIESINDYSLRFNYVDKLFNKYEDLWQTYSEEYSNLKREINADIKDTDIENSGGNIFVSVEEYNYPFTEDDITSAIYDVYRENYNIIDIVVDDIEFIEEDKSFVGFVGTWYFPINDQNITLHHINKMYPEKEKLIDDFCNKFDDSGEGTEAIHHILNNFDDLTKLKAHDFDVFALEPENVNTFMSFKNEVEKFKDTSRNNLIGFLEKDNPLFDITHKESEIIVHEDLLPSYYRSVYDPVKLPYQIDTIEIKPKTESETMSFVSEKIEIVIDTNSFEVFANRESGIEFLKEKLIPEIEKEIKNYLLDLKKDNEIQFKSDFYNLYAITDFVKDNFPGEIDEIFDSINTSFEIGDTISFEDVEAFLKINPNRTVYVSSDVDTYKCNWYDNQLIMNKMNINTKSFDVNYCLTKDDLIRPKEKEMEVKHINKLELSKHHSFGIDR
ncbi:MAG: hypothetical protein ACRCUP_01290 [Mycoplasmatales bacterium]